MSTIINATTTNGVVIQPDNSGSLQLATNSGTTAVTISTAQNVGIGTASPAYKLDVQGSVGSTISSKTAEFNAAGGSIYASFNDGTKTWRIGAGIQTAGIFSIRNQTDSIGAVNIDSSGNVLINSTSAVRARIGQMQIKAVSTQEALTTSSNDLSYAHWATRSADAGAGTHYLGYFENSIGTNVGAITHNNTNTSYTTSSDYRLKENIVPMTGALAIVQALKPVTYKWKQDGSDGQGFIAHELQEVVPDCVSGEKDAVDAEGKPVYQGVDTSFLVATLTAAIQEQQTIINDLKARIETLEAK
jgi:hypothetical protein